MKAAASAAVWLTGAGLTEASTPRLALIDSHIHLFDPGRPGGVPWPTPAEPVLYRPATPERYAKLASGFGVAGVVAVEASPLASDNDWLLAVAEQHPLVVGVVGNLVPGEEQFAASLDRLHRNPLYLGIRYGNLWGRDLAADIDKPGFMAGVRLLADAGLVLESANPNPGLVRALARVAAAAPALRIVLDHLPHALFAEDETRIDPGDAALHELASNPNAAVKISEVPVRGEAGPRLDAFFYRDRLDAVCGLFGPERILFGSDWPNSDTVASFSDTVRLVRRYFAGKPLADQQRYFGGNSARVYRWKPRTPAQAAVRG